MQVDEVRDKISELMSGLDCVSITVLHNKEREDEVPISVHVNLNEIDLNTAAQLLLSAKKCLEEVIKEITTDYPAVSLFMELNSFYNKTKEGEQGHE